MSQAADILAELKRDTNSSLIAPLRQHAADLLPALQSLLAGADRRLCERAAWALAMIPPAQPGAVAPILLNALHHENATVRHWAVVGCVHFSDTPELVVKPIKSSFETLALDTQRKLVAELPRLGPAAFPLLLKNLTDLDHPDLRAQAASSMNTLLESNPSLQHQAMPALLDALRDEVEIRHVAMALGRIGAAAGDAVPLLLPHIAEDADIALAVWRINHLPEVIDVLVDMIPHSSEEFLVAALDAIAEIGPAAAHAREALLDIRSEIEETDSADWRYYEQAWNRAMAAIAAAP